MKKNGNRAKMVFLIGMLYSPKHPIEVTYQEASLWASDSGFYGFFVTNKSNIILNRQVIYKKKAYVYIIRIFIIILKLLIFFLIYFN